MEELESDLLSDLKKYIQIYRCDHSLSCIWDEELSYIQKQSLWHQEMQELVDSKDPDFESCIISSLSPGTIYRGYPACFGHLNAIAMFQSLSRNKSARRILLMTGDQVRLALSTRIFFYGENSQCVWVIASVIFK